MGKFERILTRFAMFIVCLTIFNTFGLFSINNDVYADTREIVDTRQISRAKSNIPRAYTSEENSDEILVEQVQNQEEAVEVEEAEIEFIYEEQIEVVPLYFQEDYADVRYGSYGTVATHGCGITCVAMVFSYLLDEPIMPDKLAGEYGHKNTENGSLWTLFEDSAADYGLDKPVQTDDWEIVRDSLKKGQVVIANVPGGGHFIVLAAITEDGRIIVRDPSRNNYSRNKNSSVREGFSIGFDEKFLNYCRQYWIYPEKSLCNSLC